MRLQRFLIKTYIVLLVLLAITNIVFGVSYLSLKEEVDNYQISKHEYQKEQLDNWLVENKGVTIEEYIQIKTAEK